MEYNLINSIAESAKNGKTAMINNGNIISYKELKDKIDRACLYMKEETGIKERSLVLLVTPRCVEQIELMLTFFSLNIAYCNIDFNEKKTRIGHIISNSRPQYIITTAEKAKELGVKPMAKFVVGASAGVDPSIMGVGPIFSSRKALEKAGLTIDDMDLVEANEAFAAQSCAVGKTLNIPEDKLNVNGGAIALGHPVGASGCRIMVTLLHEMQKRGAKKGLATLCVGGGMGVSTIVEMD